ncbi:ectoine/hydroxyectoine ABC transporter permease subunit EhuC [Mesorhizobium erdmanii]|uniref:Ectoine/hydroxyectoine ABC transporter permease subunit EhuC n=2 Tax=Mesorhizobium TaxID=68287 RepID=A0A3M9X044_9HYPH|nr:MULTISPECIES: ectoine/hydroxyectoine ABC transporter permease subunit EhuC [Mesorhizobium]RNJ41086.1 ectoine/hydroxyectoine ABC transporter permease subunit EhuC [Mesorhizobium japonicum]RXT45898.1 ectoine/hydroxyectoine ABC transporter permease subunit EhuC [Mesorhizobium erdmanii]
MAEGAWVTVQLTVAGYALALVVALCLCLARLSRFLALRWAMGAVVEFLRGTSAFVQLFWVFFVLPLFGITLSPMIAGIIVLGLNVGAYGSELLRGALTAIPRSQWEASVAINLRKWQYMFFIALPQALIIALPTMNNMAIELLKATAIVSTITITDLTFQAELIRSATGTTAVPYISIFIVYFLMASLITLGFRRLEARLNEGLDVVKK